MKLKEMIEQAQTLIKKRPEVEEYEVYFDDPTIGHFEVNDLTADHETKEVLL